MKGIASKLFLLAAIAAPLVFHTTPVAQAAPAAIITVNSTADTNVYDSVMTLREAMLLATGDLAPIQLSQGECNQVSNSTYGPPWSTTDTIGAASADIIVFNSTTFPPASPATIALTSTLPILDTGGDTIDGSSRGVIVSGVSKAFVCFLIPSNNNTIKGLEIYNCDIGIVIQFGAGHNTIGGTTASERNVISGNEWGVEISGETYANTVWGNYIGTNAAGTSAIANSIGVYIHEWAQDNTIGGTTEGERNVISGNSVLGVQILGPDASDNVVKGNYIGTNAAGTAAIPNGHGVAIEGAQNTIIGGSSPGERNVISGNDGCGVGLYTSGNVVKGNYIGTNAAGTAAIPNGDGVRIWGGYNTIGGTTASARNVISGNGDGVDISGDLTEHNTVQGNYIGTNAAGTGAIANGTGVYIHDMAHDNTIGGSSAGERNVISGNGDGVQISGSSTGNIVKGNYIGTNA